jgi:polar amino acid transport system substrate-binding protein
MGPTRPETHRGRGPGTSSVAALALLLAVTAGSPATARPLDAIMGRGLLALCAHANALPFASKTADPPGFQIELAQALAEQLGVRLTVDWVTSGFQFRTADCDIILDTIAVPEAQAERRLQLSRPYQRSGVALAVRPGTAEIRGFADLNGGHRVAVKMGSLAAKVLGQRGVGIISFGFEDEMVAALARGEIDAAAVSPATVAYFNLTHQSRPLRLIHAYETEPELSWDLVVGLRRSDRLLREAIDAALERLLADGTVQRIYSRYGIEHRLPRPRE